MMRPVGQLGYQSDETKDPKLDRKLSWPGLEAAGQWCVLEKSVVEEIAHNCKRFSGQRAFPIHSLHAGACMSFRFQLSLG